MNDRQAHVLYCLVDEYIRTARPVGSIHLVSRLRLAASAATIRIILRELDNEQYVSQPHLSAGRIPTDRGYRFYVNGLAIRRPTTEQVRQLSERWRDYQQTYESPARAAAKLLAALAQSIAIGGWLTSRDIHEAGISSLFDQPEGASSSAIREMSSLLDHIDEYVDQYTREPATGTQVYIGQENPAYRAQHTSVLVRTVQRPDGEAVVLMLAGPKRMAYRRNLAVLNRMASVVEQV
jgi:heat-inducible transcriptional repressor